MNYQKQHPTHLHFGDSRNSIVGLPMPISGRGKDPGVYYFPYNFLTFLSFAMYLIHNILLQVVEKKYFHLVLNGTYAMLAYGKHDCAK